MIRDRKKDIVSEGSIRLTRCWFDDEDSMCFYVVSSGKKAVGLFRKIPDAISRFEQLVEEEAGNGNRN